MITEKILENRNEVNLFLLACLSKSMEGGGLNERSGKEDRIFCYTKIFQISKPC